MVTRYTFPKLESTTYFIMILILFKMIGSTWIFQEEMIEIGEARATEMREQK